MSYFKMLLAAVAIFVAGYVTGQIVALGWGDWLKAVYRWQTLIGAITAIIAALLGGAFLRSESKYVIEKQKYARVMAINAKIADFLMTYGYFQAQNAWPIQEVNKLISDIPSELAATCGPVAGTFFREIIKGINAYYSEEYDANARKQFLTISMAYARLLQDHLSCIAKAKTVSEFEFNEDKIFEQKAECEKYLQVVADEKSKSAAANRKL